jgi:alkanesulfonate monooxygenase
MPKEFSTRFHWGSPADQTWRDPIRFIDVCRRAEQAGFESVQVPVASRLAEALTLAMAAATETRDVRFRIACECSGMPDPLWGTELRDACAALEGRLILHVGLGDDGASSGDGHFARAGRFLDYCRGLFPGSAGPDLDVEGQTAEAAFLAIKQSDRLWRRPDWPTTVDADALPVLHFGKQVGLVGSLVARETRRDALEAAAVLIPEAADRLDDSAFWAAPYLWIGGASAPAGETAVLIGSFEEIARAIRRYEKGGISSLLIRGWGAQKIDEREMAIVGAGVLPRI